MNKRQRHHPILFIVVIGMIILSSCNKNDFLNTKPSSTLVVPSTLADFQSLLNDVPVMQETPELGELSTDDFYLTDSFWLSLPAEENNAYVWAPDIFGSQGGIGDWNFPYEQAFYANVVLDGLPNISINSENLQEWKMTKAAALFIRAYAFYNIAQVFAPVYDNSTAASDLGIPLRLTSDVNPVSTRATVKQTYAQILLDLQTASAFFPYSVTDTFTNQPNKAATLAMLARVYLSMRDYPDAGLYADSCLKLYGALVNYNMVSSSLAPFRKPNAEILYESRSLSSSSVLVGGHFYPGLIVDSNLYRSYADSDLRKNVFYFINGSGFPNFKGTYNASFYPFTGLATDEMYLIRAECSARAGHGDSAANDLNTLLINRWATGSFIPYPSTMSPAAALDTVLVERRKELAFRGLRWTDLRRLNKEGANIQLSRVLDGQSYSLSPNDPRYVLPIPPDVISLSGIAQNPR